MKYHNKIAKNIIVLVVVAISAFSVSTLSAQFSASTMPAPLSPVIKSGISPVKPPILLPNPNELVLLSIKPQRQEVNLCLPTSVSMMLAKFGWNYPPRQIKLASLGKPYYGPSTPFSYWSTASTADMLKALEYLGIRTWKSTVYSNDDTDFTRGLNDIKSSLRKGYPIMAIIQPNRTYLHAVVISGFDEQKKLIYTVDPAAYSSTNGVITYSYDRFKIIWRNASNNRSLLFMFK